MKCGNTLQESLTNIMVNLACPESVETIKNFTILSTLQERLKDTNVISEIFHGKIHGWSKASPVPCRKIVSEMWLTSRTLKNTCKLAVACQKYSTTSSVIMLK
jgi:hypothetical protein